MRPAVTQTLEMVINQLANMKRLENICRNHLRSTKKLETEVVWPAVTQTLEMFINQLANMKRLENI